MQRKHSVVAIIVSIAIAVAMTFALFFATVFGLNHFVPKDTRTESSDSLFLSGFTASATVTFVAASVLGNWMQKRRTGKCSPPPDATRGRQIEKPGPNRYQHICGTVPIRKLAGRYRAAAEPM